MSIVLRRAAGSISASASERGLWRTCRIHARRNQRILSSKNDRAGIHLSPGRVRWVVATTIGDEGEFTVRRAVRADLLAVFRIEKRSFPQPWPYAAFERFLGEPGFLVAETDEGVAGYVVADTVPNGGRPLGHIKDIAVHPDRRGRGVGTTLLERALTVLSEQRTSRVKLEVRESNGVALDLYRTFGFAVQRTLPRYYDDGENAYVMTRSLA